MDDPLRAAEELANRIVNPKAAEGLPNTIEEHAAYVRELIVDGPKPEVEPEQTPEQVAAAAVLAEREAVRLRDAATKLDDGALAKVAAGELTMDQAARDAD